MVYAAVDGLPRFAAQRCLAGGLEGQGEAWLLLLQHRHVVPRIFGPFGSDFAVCRQGFQDRQPNQAFEEPFEWQVALLPHADRGRCIHDDHARPREAHPRVSFGQIGAAETGSPHKLHELLQTE